jgi:glycosyltransferase involved in cell wall biosynthesis
MRVLIPWYDWPPFSSSAIGGLSVSLWNLASGLSRIGTPVDVIVPPGHLRKPAEAPGPKAYETPLAESLRTSRSLSRSDLRFLDDYDRIVSIHNFGARSFCHDDVKPRVARQIHTVLRAQPLAYTLPLHARPFDYLRMYGAKRSYVAIEGLLKGTDTACVSNFLKELMDRFNISGAKDRVIPIGVDLKIFRPLSIEPRYEFLFVGKDEHVKGVDVLFDALRVCVARGLSPRVGVLGHFSDENRRRLLAALPTGLAGKVEFLGVVANERMRDFYNSAGCTVIPSRYETFSVVGAEAMACGVPVVASRVGSLPETLSPPASRLVDRHEDPRALADTMVSALRDEALRSEARVSGPVFAKRFDLESTTSQFAGMLGN